MFLTKNLTLIILIIATFYFNSFANKNFIVVCEEWPPFEFIQNDKPSGIDVEIANIIFKKLNISVEYKILPWKRAWAMVETGEADAVFSLSRKKTREPYVWYPTENMWISEYVFFVLKENKKNDFKGYESIKKDKLSVGVVGGNSYHSSFWNAFPYTDGSTEFKGDLSSNTILNPQLQSVTKLDQNLVKLVGGRIDLFIADKTIGLYTVKMKGFSDKITFYDVVIYSKPYPIAFTKNSKYPNIKDIFKKFELELKKMKDSGEYQIILDKWLK